MPRTAPAGRPPAAGPFARSGRLCGDIPGPGGWSWFPRSITSGPSGTWGERLSCFSEREPRRARQRVSGSQASRVAGHAARSARAWVRCSRAVPVRHQRERQAFLVTARRGPQTGHKKNSPPAGAGGPGGGPAAAPPVGTVLPPGLGAVVTPALTVHRHVRAGSGGLVPAARLRLGRAAGPGTVVLGKRSSPRDHDPLADSSPLAPDHRIYAAPFRARHAC